MDEHVSRRMRDDKGETLLEVIISVVILGLVVGAFFSSIITTTTASTTHRNLVTADAVLRDYAEATKSAVRIDCPTHTTFTTTTIPGYSASSSTNQCPVDLTHVRQVDITATL